MGRTNWLGLGLRTQHRPALLISVVPLLSFFGKSRIDQPLIKTDRIIPTSIVATRTIACFRRAFMLVFEIPLTSIFLMFVVDHFPFEDSKMVVICLSCHKIVTEIIHLQEYFCGVEDLDWTSLKPLSMLLFLFVSVH